MIRQFNLDDLNDILIQPDAPLDENDNDDTYEEDFENENLSKASSPSYKQHHDNTNTNNNDDTYANDTFLSEHETAEFTAISSPEVSMSSRNALIPSAVINSNRQQETNVLLQTSGKNTTKEEDDQQKRNNDYSDEEYSMDESVSSLNTVQKRSLISPFQQFDEAYPQEQKTEKYATIIKPLQSSPVVPVVNIKNKKVNYQDSKKFSAIHTVDASCVPGVPHNDIRNSSIRDQANMNSPKGLNEDEVRNVVRSMMTAHGITTLANNTGSDSSSSSRSSATPAYSIDDIMRKAIHLQAPRLRPDVAYSADFPVVKDHHDHRVIVSKKELRKGEEFEEVPETKQPTETIRRSSVMPQGGERLSVHRSNAIAATFDREVKSSAYLMTGKDPVELTLKCDEIYSNFLSDLISACRKQAALSISSEEMAMHRVLAEQMAQLYTDRNQIDNIRSKMIWAAREISLYKTEESKLKSTKEHSSSSSSSRGDNNNIRASKSSVTVTSKNADKRGTNHKQISARKV